MVLAEDGESIPADGPPAPVPLDHGKDDDPATRDLREDPSRLGGHLARERDRLRRIVAIRLDARLNARVDASDVVQETCIEAAERLEDFLRSAPMPFAIWLRFLACQRLAQIHRRHLGAGKRAASRETALDDSRAPAADASTLAGAIVRASQTSPSDAVARAEEIERVRAALERLRPEDRSVLVLRHFEHWNNQEIARILNITEGGASLRYSRAAMRLRDLLDGPGPRRQ
jgi:RNA polymerase sigma-70 factor (ECF subfamily)